MAATSPAAPGRLERTYVAYCIASEIVRIRRSVNKYVRTNQQARDVSPLLTRPLEAIATALGMSHAVQALVRDALEMQYPSVPATRRIDPPGAGNLHQVLMSGPSDGRLGH